MPLVLTFLNFLHENYGRITPQQLDNKKTTLKSMTLNPAQPIEIIFNSVDDLVESARADEAELTQIQTINLTVFILHRQRIIKDNIWAWKRTNPAYKTWENFKQEFREAHLELRETGRTIDELGFHNSNAIVDQRMVHPQIDKDECAATDTHHATKFASVNQANATMESHIKTILYQVQALQFTNTHGHQTNHRKSFGRRRGRGRGCGSSKVTGYRQSSTPTTPKYCWTHRNCAHGSEGCTYPSDGHKKDATFAVMMGGDTIRCYSIT